MTKKDANAVKTNALLERFKKTSSLKFTQELDDSDVLVNPEFTDTHIPALNVLFSGRLDGGFTSGVSVFQGESKTGKTVWSLVCAKAYMDKYPDSVLLYYDSELGASKRYFSSLGIETSRVLHIPVTTVEELKIDLVKQLEGIELGDHVIIVLDSLGNLASRKEINDAMTDKDTADMSRAKSVKSLFRMIGCKLGLKRIPMIVVNHTYSTMEMFSKEVGSSGRGLVYVSQNIYTITKSQEKKGTDVIGYNFNLNVTKSRFSREKTRIPITMTFDGGIKKWSGLLDMALLSGDIVKPSNGWYSVVETDTGTVEEKRYRESETDNAEFWTPILERPHFRKWVEDTYSIANKPLMVESDDTKLPDAEIRVTD